MTVNSIFLFSVAGIKHSTQEAFASDSHLQYLIMIVIVVITTTTFSQHTETNAMSRGGVSTRLKFYEYCKQASR